MNSNNKITQNPQKEENSLSKRQILYNSQNTAKSERKMKFKILTASPCQETLYRTTPSKQLEPD
jgi:hypothetical protein